MQCPADPAPSAASGSESGQPSPLSVREAALLDSVLSLVQDIKTLTETIRKQTQAIDGLSMAIVQIVDMEDDTTEPAGQYLDGSPVK